MTPFQVIVKVTLVTIVGAACHSSSRARAADTSAASAETLSITPRDTAATATADTVIANAPTASTDETSESSVVQPIACTPTTFGPSDTVTLRMGTPHGNQLSIHSPNRTTYSLVYPTPGKPRRNYSLIPSQEFRNVGTFPVAADVRAIPEIYGRDTTVEPVFVEPGKYLIVMGENLASDYSNRSTYCTVTFRPR
jgi:hypothetical protein